MPILVIHVKEITKHLKFDLGSSERHFSMDGFCAHEAFEVYCEGAKIDGNRFPVNVYMAASITKSKLELVQYLNGNASFVAKLAISESQLLELCTSDFSTSQVRISLESGDSYSSMDGYATLRCGDAPDGNELLWNPDLTPNAVQTIKSFVLSISKRLD